MSGRGRGLPEALRASRVPTVSLPEEGRATWRARRALSVSSGGSWRAGDQDNSRMAGLTFSSHPVFLLHVFRCPQKTGRGRGELPGNHFCLRVVMFLQDADSEC